MRREALKRGDFKEIGRLNKIEKLLKDSGKKRGRKPDVEKILLKISKMG